MTLCDGPLLVPRRGHNGRPVFLAGTALLPDIPDCVKEVNTETNIITVHIMKGLLD